MCGRHFYEYKNTKKLDDRQKKLRNVLVLELFLVISQSKKKLIKIIKWNYKERL